MHRSGNVELCVGQLLACCVPSCSHHTGCAFSPVVTVNAPSSSVTTAITIIIFSVTTVSTTAEKASVSGHLLSANNLGPEYCHSLDSDSRFVTPEPAFEVKTTCFPPQTEIALVNIWKEKAKGEF